MKFWAPITHKGEVVKPGDRIEDFRGMDSIYIRVSRAPEPEQGKTGKIIVQEPGHPENERELYPSVFNLHLESIEL